MSPLPVESTDITNVWALLIVACSAVVTSVLAYLAKRDARVAKSESREAKVQAATTPEALAASTAAMSELRTAIVSLTSATDRNTETIGGVVSDVHVLRTTVDDHGRRITALESERDS